MLKFQTKSTLKQAKTTKPIQIPKKRVLKGTKQIQAKIDDLVFFKVLEENNLPRPEIEFKFHEKRKWRLDYAYPSKKIAIEKEGGVFTGGRHTQPIGFLKDMEKYNHLAAAGWHLFRATPKSIRTKEFVILLKELYESKN